MWNTLCKRLPSSLYHFPVDSNELPDDYMGSSSKIMEKLLKQAFGVYPPSTRKYFRRRTQALSSEKAMDQRVEQSFSKPLLEGRLLPECVLLHVRSDHFPDRRGKRK